MPWILGTPGLLTYFLASLLITVWFRTIFVATAAFCLVHYFVVWPGWGVDLRGEPLALFQIAYQVAMWLGVLSGLVVSLIMRFPVLARWPYDHGRPALWRTSAALFLILGCQSLYELPLERLFPWNLPLAGVAVLVAYLVAFPWLLPVQRSVFRDRKDLRRFLSVLAGVHLTCLAVFGVVEIAAKSRVDESLAVWWKLGALVTLTFSLVFFFVVTRMVRDSDEPGEVYRLVEVDAEAQATPEGAEAQTGMPQEEAMDPTPPDESQD